MTTWRNKWVMASVLGVVVADALAFDDLYDDIPTFITPANMTSSYKDTPNSITSLEIDELGYLGIDNFVDAMRLVPGMIVAETYGSSSTIGYHGTNVQVPRRMQILYNSNRMYRSGYADLLWQRMPIEMHDLERIEVVRGTNITDFGANAFTSTVNMIQKPVALETGADVYVKSSTNGETRALASAAGNILGSKGYLRFASVKGDGFDESPQLESFDDDFEGFSVLYNGEYELNNSMLLDWYVAGSDYEYEFPPFDNIFSNEAEIQATVGGFSGNGPTSEKMWSGNIKLSGTSGNSASQAGWKVGIDITTFDRDQDLQFCFPAFFYDPILAQLDAADNVRLAVSDLELLLGSSLMFGVGALNDSILSPLSGDQQQLLADFGQRVQASGLEAVAGDLCSDTDQNLSEDRYSFFAGYDRTSEGFTVSSDVLVRKDNVNSQTYLQGAHGRTSYEWSNNLRYRVTDSVALNMGVMAESNSDIDKVYFSPRVSLNYSINTNNIIRILGAHSHRLPGIHETERRWKYDVRFVGGVQDYYGRSEAQTLRLSTAEDLDPEELKAFELGYTYLGNANRTVIDFKYFNEEYTNLISEPFSYIAFGLSNDGEADLKGAELGFSHTFATSRLLKVGGGFAHIDNDANNDEEQSLYSQWSGNAWVIVGLSSNWNLGLVYFGSQNHAQKSYDRFDINLGYEVDISSSELALDFNYRHVPSLQANYTEYSSTDPFLLGYDDSNIFSIKAELSF
ncbi:MAG: TonB-dependent receptor plug domain-containing protein [Gammaproteobacteria bacterium]|nr:TonB-dependent receptor plug domain-containing protein [Gammaproteobacteria bacterium]